MKMWGWDSYVLKSSTILYFRRWSSERCRIHTEYASTLFSTQRCPRLSFRLSLHFRQVGSLHSPHINEDNHPIRVGMGSTHFWERARRCSHLVTPSRRVR